MSQGLPSIEKLRAELFELRAKLRSVRDCL